MSAFQMEPNDYPHFFLAEYERLCSTGLHCPGFPRVLYDALIRLDYDGDAPVYRCRLSKVHNLDMCEVSVTIPLNPAHAWSGSIIGSEPNTGVEMMAHIALTPCARTTSELLRHCLLRFSQFRIRRTPYGSSVLRLCLTSTALISMRG
jgi:hypothetical protein